MPDSIVDLEDEPIPGLADLVESHPGADAEALAAELLERARSVGVGLPVSRGPGRYLGIVERIRGRRLVKDLGQRDFTVDWFAFHVPPGGSGRLKVGHKSQETAGLKLKVLGLGFGSGRSLSLALEDDYGERSSCLRLRRTFEGQFQAYEDRSGQQYIQVDVLRVVKDQQSTLAVCDRCGVGALPPLDFTPAPGVAIDVTDDPRGRSLSDVLTIKDDRELELSLPIKFPGLDITPGVALKREVELECSYAYTLPGGRCYTPYRDADGWQDFPFWLAT